MDANGLSQNHLKNHAKAFKIIQIHLTIIENPSNILQNPPKIIEKTISHHPKFYSKILEKKNNIQPT
jgi:hypothetical protein